MIYLDGLSATEPSSRVTNAFLQFSKESWGDLGAPYSGSNKLFEARAGALQKLYELVGAESDDRFLFTSGEADACANVFHSVLINHVHATGKNHLLSSCIATASIVKGVGHLERMGCECDYLPLNELGLLTPEVLEEAITPRTAILALPWVDSLTGVIQPIWELAEICKKHDVLVYVQGSEIFAKLFFRFQDMPIDFLSFEGNKFHAPKATGGLFVKKGVMFDSLTHENDNRNVAGLVAMGEAAGEVLDYMGAMSTEVPRLRAMFEDELLSKIPEIVFFGRESNRVPNASCFSVEGIHAEPLLYHLYQLGVIATRGGGDRQKLEFILQSMGVSRPLSKGAISCSVTMHTTEEGVAKATRLIAEGVDRVRKVSYV